MLTELIHDIQYRANEGRVFPEPGDALVIGLNGGVPWRDMEIEVACGVKVVWLTTGEVVSWP